LRVRPQFNVMNKNLGGGCMAYGVFWFTTSEKEKE